ncbi:MAG: glycerol kinase GlpK [Candidatus Rokubacteria bacterium]|nr:glycerol kinase GlpK [Candidatus Rokubacteria bacterium]MBI3825402.1 glycerol kinase GlpK [Candidatus Rokubacteria bacterium]
MTAGRFVLALDQGTSGSTALLVDERGTVRARGYAELPQYYPRPGWVEHDPEEIWATTVSAARAALGQAGATGAEVAAVGITNQRETTIVWERASGAPIARAIVWQCRRTAEACDRLRAAGLEPLIRERTGLVLDAYFSGTKIGWLLDHVPGARLRAERGELACGTVDAWLIWKLTGGRAHVTDASNASRTLCLSLATVDWDEELLRVLGVPRPLLPRVGPSSGVLGETADLGWLPAGIPIAGVAGDQQAALFGQACFEPGTAKNTYGTGCFLLLNTGATPLASRHGLLTTVAWRIGETTTYALEGSVFIAGAAVQWLRDGLGIIRSAAQTQALAESVPDTGGVYFVPAFVGLGAPYWDMYARGAIVGLTRGTTAAHLARAALEAIAFQSRDVLDAMTEDARSVPGGLRVPRLRVDGGAAANDFLCQFQADVADVPVVRPAVIETTALGAAHLAGLGAGIWKSQATLAERAAVDRTFTPRMDATTRDRLYDGWRRAVERARAWERSP